MHIKQRTVSEWPPGVMKLIHLNQSERESEREKRTRSCLFLFINVSHKTIKCYR